MSSTQLTNQITADVKALASGDLAEGAMKLFRTLGYESTRVVPDVDDDRPAAFLERLQANVTDTLSEQEFRKVVSSVKLLFQVTDSEIQSAGSQTADMFSSMADASDTNITQSFFFAVAELKDETYPRGVYARVAREINKRLPLATVVLMRNDSNNVSLAFVDRREHRRQPGRAVLGNVALLREIDTEEPHRAHLDILSELALDDRLAWIANNGTRNDFAGLLAAWLDVLNTEELNKRFYQGLFKWYQRAMKVAKFPTSDEPVEEQVIRLITRLMFVWFIKEKQFVARELFDEHQVSMMLKDYDAAGGDSYYRCILQNLFFGTLNTPVEDRDFATDSSLVIDNTNEFGFNFRYIDEIEQVEKLHASFHISPFINGGLFDCLDERDATGGMIKVVDCFSDEPEHTGLMSVPNRLFFDYDGIVTHFNRFKFTVEESTPLEQEVALDPELLGNVFESLLAAYVPETKQTKQAKTGSYYTPRKVVDYMVDEGLKESLLARVSDALATRDDLDEKIIELFDYGIADHPFSADEAQALVQAIAETKILDPAVGSGAFPMATLHKLTLALRKLDPTNDRWRELQLNLAMERTEEAYGADTQAERDKMLKEISIIFETYKGGDYGRKLFLIQNCIFGVDIQPIAVQISKLRFFISLAIEQQRNDALLNYGIRALPNLETRFLCADSLTPLRSPKKWTLGKSEELRDRIRSLSDNREKFFRAYDPYEKSELRSRDTELRKQLSSLLRRHRMPVTDAELLADWNPMEQGEVAPWFDREYMFGVSHGFDLVVGNPPYKQVNRQQYSNEWFPFAQGKDKGKQNLYKLFIEHAYNMLADRGLATLIVQSSVLCDVSSSGTRELLLMHADMKQAIEFPKSPPRREFQVFKGVTQGTCILSFQKSDTATRSIRVSVDNDLRTLDEPTFETLSTNDILNQYPGRLYIPLVSRDAGDIWTKVRHRPDFVSLDSLSAVILKGDLRLDADREHYSQCETPVRLIRGDSIERYKVRWDTIDDFCDPYFRMEAVAQNRDNMVLVFRNVSGTNDIRRLNVALVGRDAPLCLTSDSTNKIVIKDQESSEAMMALLNSRLVDWWFRLTSTNNHVNVYELRELCIPHLDDEVRDQLTELSRERLRSKPNRGVSVEREIDELVYRLYELTPSEIKTIDAGVA